MKPIVWWLFYCSIKTVFLAEQPKNINNYDFPMDKIQDSLCQSYCINNNSNSSREVCTIEECKCDVAMINGTDVFLGKSVSKPTLQCIDDIYAHFTWTAGKKDEVYFFQYWTTENGSFSTDITFCDSFTLEDLEEDTRYELRFWEVSFRNNSVTCSEIFEITTLEKNITPSPIANIQLNQLFLQDDEFNAVIQWEPNKEMSCNYDLIYYGQNVLGAYEHLEIEIPLQLYNVTIDKLNFGSSYTVEVMAKGPNGITESTKKSLAFVTPTCLEAYSNLTKCAPSKPQNLEISEKSLDERIPNENYYYYDVTLTWSKPNLVPDFYVANLMKIDNIDMMNSSGFSLNISGEETSATFHRVDVGLHYQVSLNAWSKVGASEKAISDRHMTMNSFVPPPETWSIPLIILGILGPVFIVLVLAVILLLFRRYRKKKQRIEQRCKYFASLDDDVPETDVLQGIDSIEYHEVDEWELDQRKLYILNVLGEGAFGLVKKGYLETVDGEKQDVAIKMLKECSSNDEMRQFAREIEIMKSVKPHPYVVSMLGCVTVARIGGPLLVVEYCSRGNLQTYLRNGLERLTAARRQIMVMDQNFNHSINVNYFSNILYEINTVNLCDDFLISPKHLLSIARQVAIGMEHLSKSRVVHRDLAARNVLVCQDHTVKVSDFGLSRDVYRDNVYFKAGGGRLPIRWMALESLTHQRYTTESDVWSFGILVWEIVTLGGTPYAGIQTQDLLEMLKSGGRLGKPCECSPELYEIMMQCWQNFPSDRPTFGKIKKSLEDLLEQDSDYINFNLGENKTAVE